MSRFAVLLAGAVLALVASVPARAGSCSDLWEWVEPACRRLADTYEKGGDELLVSGFAWHIPATWTPEKRAEENENAWGGGWAKTVERPNGDTDTVYFLVFSDSHKDAQFNLGYAWNRYWGERGGLQDGLGWTGFIMQRPDIASGVPVPVLLPLVSLRWDKVTVHTTFIPTLNGGINNGSILYVFGKVQLF